MIGLDGQFTGVLSKLMIFARRLSQKEYFSYYGLIQYYSRFSLYLFKMNLNIVFETFNKKTMVSEGKVTKRNKVDNLGMNSESYQTERLIWESEGSFWRKVLTYRLWLSTTVRSSRNLIA